MKAHRELVHNGPFDEVLYTSNKEILEGTTFSFFIVSDGEVKTSKADGRILGSITRKNLLRIMNEKNINHSEEIILVDDILTADEAFIASANRDLIPVTSIDGKKIGNGNIGSVYKQLMSLYSEEIHTKNK
jgi:branched-subunit amino acid aminotransferase/4-amino-4-deoxychorismate lyase